MDSAQIFLDEFFTGKYTPDTISASIGMHEILLRKQLFQDNSKIVQIEAGKIIPVDIQLTIFATPKIVLIEDFSNVSCIPCVESNIILHSLMTGTLNTKAVLIKYATNFPSPNDPMYQDAQKFSDSRMTFYSIFSTPTVFVDGLQKPIASDSNDIKRKVSERLQTKSPFRFDFSGSHILDSVKVFLNIYKLDSSVDLTDVHLYTVLIEEEIVYSTPPGSNGEKKFFNVMRNIMPSESGISLKSLTSGSLKVNFSIGINPVWQQAKLALISFAQNTKTKEVFESGYFKFVQAID